MKKVSIILENITKVLLVFFISLLIISTTLQVFSRFILKSPIIWTEEVTRMSFIWMALLGATLGTKYNEHLAIDFLTANLSSKKKKYVELIIHIIMIVVSVVLIIGGWVFVQKNIDRISVTTSIPMYYLYISAPLTGFIMLYYLIEKIPELLKKG